MARRSSSLVAIAIGAVLAAPPAVATDAKPVLQLSTLSNRADLVSGGDVLVEVRSPDGRRLDRLTVEAGGVDVSAAFSAGTGSRARGLVERLPLGPTRLVARASGFRAAVLTVTNHPRGGPVLSGPQVRPWACQTVENGLGPAVDDQCNAAPVYQDVVLSNGVRAGYEKGTINRGIYQVVVPANWNGKLIWLFGAGTGQTYRQGTPGQPLVAGAPPVPLSSVDAAAAQGFATASSTMTDNGQHSNDVTSAETVMMVKEHIIERYGEITYTVGQGGSGGALQQYLIADAYPGLLDALRPTQDWPDQVVGAYREFADCALLVRAMNQLGTWSDDAKRTLVFGHGGTGVCATAAGRAPDYMSPDDGTDCAGAASYDAATNPRGIRCTLQDFMVSIWGHREQGCAGQGTPCARRPYDNTGVQYGFAALRAGRITAEDFVALNASVGGYDINMRWVPQRSVADHKAVEIAHRTGRVVFGRNLARVPIVVERSTNNNDYHYPFRTEVVRRRLDRANGGHANHVVWTGGTDGSTLALVDAWLMAVAADRRPGTLPQKVVRNRPANAVDACWIDRVKTTDAATCRRAYPVFGDTRVAAGEPRTSDLLACPLTPIRRSAYPVRFSASQWKRLTAAFPRGVCDYSSGRARPGFGAGPRVPSSWVSFAREGGASLGPPPRSWVLA